MSEHTKLPLDLLDCSATVGRMEPGSQGWTVPWAMWVDADMRCWLHAGYTLSDGPDGTAQMRVTRRRDGSYAVLAPPGERWDPSAEHGFIGRAEFVPVAALEVGDEASQP